MADAVLDDWPAARKKPPTCVCQPTAAESREFRKVRT